MSKSGLRRTSPSSPPGPLRLSFPPFSLSQSVLISIQALIPGKQTGLQTSGNNLRARKRILEIKDGEKGLVQRGMVAPELLFFKWPENSGYSVAATDWNNSSVIGNDSWKPVEYDAKRISVSSWTILNHGKLTVEDLPTDTKISRIPWTKHSVRQSKSVRTG